MTWVVGIANLGVGVVVADVRVSVSEPTIRDITEFGVRKLHPITPSICAGFAGSISAGFTAMTSLSNAASKAASLGTRPEPEELVSDWLSQLQNCSEAADLDRLAGRYGCQLMVVGVSPARDVLLDNGSSLWPSSRVWTINLSQGVHSPTVDTPTSLRPMSIGSGAEIYCEALDTYDLNDLIGLMDVTRNRQALASLFVSWGFSSAVQSSPAVGVSPHMHAALVTREGTGLATNETDASILPPGARPAGAVETFPPIANTWEETLRLAELAGFHGESTESLLSIHNERSSSS